MQIAARVARAARAAWDDPRWGPIVKLLVATAALVALVEGLFGRTRVVPFGTFVTGVVIGSLYALIAFGLILVYRANRIVSFAQGTIGAVPAVLAVILVANHGLPYVLGVLIVLGGAALSGAVVEFGVMRRFRQSPRLIVTVATIGVAQILALVEFYVPIWLGGSGISGTNFPTPFTRFRFNIPGLVMSGDFIVVLVVVAAVMIGLGLFFRYTSIGIAVRASAENADRASLLGIPVRRVSTVVWGIAGVCSGLGIFLRAPVVGLPIGGLIGYTLLLYALTAAIVARMESLPVALLAGMAIGVIDQSAVYSGHRNMTAGLMLPLIVGALLLQSGRLQRALDTGVSSFRALREFRPVPAELRDVPLVRWATRGGPLATVALFLALPWIVGYSNVGYITTMVVYAIIGVSLVVLTGWAGQISLGQFAFAGLGAGVAGGLAANHRFDFFAALFIAALVGAAVAVLIGLPALRVQGLFLAVSTLAFAAFIEQVVLNRDFFDWLLPQGDNHVGRPFLYGRFDLAADRAFYYVCLAFLALCYLSARSLRASRSGRVFISVRDNVRSAQSYGMPPAGTRLAAFAIAGFYAALAGGLIAYQQGAVDHTAFPLASSIELFILVVVGGLSSLPGALLGAAYIVGVAELLPRVIHIKNLDLLGTGVGVLVVLYFLPGGLSEVAYGIRDWFLRWVARREDIVVPSLLADRGTEAPGTDETARVTAPAATDALLSCRGVDVAYDGVQVLFGVDMDVADGEIVALLGTNGAGKSTVLKAISGLVDPVGGSIVFSGQDITHGDPVDKAKLGIVQMPGGKSVFPTLTVAEHLRAAAWLFKDDEPRVQAAVAEVLERFPRLEERFTQLAGNLSGGEQQQLGLAMAFMSKPRLLIIDELSLGLAPTIVEQLLEIVREIHGRGTTIVIVEQSVNIALTIAHRAYFMEKGEVRFEGPTSELVARDDIVRSVFLEGASKGTGGKRPPTAEVRAARAKAPAGERSVLLEARELTRSFGGIRAVDGVDLQLREGEILGLIGPNGAGKTTIFDLLSGFIVPDRGTVWFKGEDVTGWPPDRRARAGLGRIFQDARIFPSMTVAENLAQGLERHLEVHDHVAAALGLPAVREVEVDVAWTVKDLVELMGLEAFRDKFVSELSTGSRRVVELAMAIAHDPDVLILDEPSSGIAQRETEALGPLLERIREETGCAMLVIEHDMPLITSVSDEIIALELGSVIARAPASEIVRDPRVIASYLGADEATIKRSGDGGLRRRRRRATT